jgi:hypothetical protein
MQFLVQKTQSESFKIEMETEANVASLTPFSGWEPTKEGTCSFVSKLNPHTNF